MLKLLDYVQKRIPFAFLPLHFTFVLSALNVQNAMTLGLLPPVDPDKIYFIGNSSLAGARALLLSEQTKKKTEALVRKIRYVSLATNPRFQDTFIAALDFGWRSDSR